MTTKKLLTFLKYQSYIFKTWPLILIFATIFIFHIKLFFPQLSIYITPDYGRSDAWHLSIANKYFYAEQLKNNKIPIWNPHIGTGYPTLAEGQTGIFFLPNIILLRTLPFTAAYNLLIVLAFVVSACGAYFFLRSLGIAKLGSTYGAIIFSLGSFFVFHVQHLHLIQTASLVPWTFWTTNEFLKNNKYYFVIFLSLIISQQLFAGFPQIVAYNLIFLVFYSILIAKKQLRLKITIVLSIFIILGFFLAAIQIIPTYEFLNNSAKIKDPKTILEQFPFQFKNLLQLMNPFLLGSPKDASYPAWVPGSWGMFWENTAYVGIIPLSLSIALAISTFLKYKKYKKEIFVFGIFFLLAIALSLGKNSPLHPLFSIPPFSLFRVPSRFLLFAQLSLAVLSTIYLSSLKIRLAIFIFLVSVLELFLVLFPYNPTSPSKTWFETPQTAKFLDAINHQRIITFGNFVKWNETFLKEGWKDLSYYNFARNYLDQNSNLIFQKDQFFSYESITTKRSSLISQLVHSAVKIESEEIEISPSLINFLSTRNVSHFISTKKIDDENLKEVYETKFNGDNEVKIYKIEKSPKKVIAATNYYFNQFPSEIVKKISESNYDPETEPVLEKNIGKLDSTDINVEIIAESDNKIDIQIEANGKGIIIYNQSFYPGWKASLNNKEVEIIPTNINSQGVVIPSAGEYTLSIVYKPNSLKAGALTSIISLVFLVTFAIFFKNKTLK